MKLVIKLEELGLLMLGIYFFSLLDYQWWWFLVLILAPDFSMIGYFFGKKVGVISYNLFHHKGVAIAIYLVGIYFNQQDLQLGAVILFSHSSLDRLLGYGLKYESGFKYTHLGIIGNE